MLQNAKVQTRCLLTEFVRVAIVAWDKMYTKVNPDKPGGGATRGHVMWLGHFEVVEPADCAGHELSEYYPIGTDADPEAVRPETWAESFGAGKLATLMDRAKVPISNDIVETLTASVDATVTFRLGLEDSPMGQRNVIREVFSDGERELGGTAQPVTRGGQGGGADRIGGRGIGAAKATQAATRAATQAGQAVDRTAAPAAPRRAPAAPVAAPAARQPAPPARQPAPPSRAPTKVPQDGSVTQATGARTVGRGRPPAQPTVADTQPATNGADVNGGEVVVAEGVYEDPQTGGYMLEDGTQCDAAGTPLA